MKFACFVQRANPVAERVQNRQAVLDWQRTGQVGQRRIGRSIRSGHDAGLSFRNERTFFMIVVIDSISRSLNESLLKSA